MKINVLTSDIYNYIAAGEVVERPASVVKELVENSIDAGATIVEIEVMGGGIDEIRVSDNGSGIESGELKTAFLPHATSKIKNVGDLDNILTLGFRGEALASIAAVSKVQMTSKTQNEDTAACIKIEGGKVISLTPASRTEGTTTTVRELFYCVPARQKFLKKPKAEEQEITNLVSRFILSHPEISFTYIADGRRVFESSGKTSREAMFAIYGKSAIDETLSVALQRGEYKVEGFVGRPSYCKPNRTYQTLIINGRYVINQTVATAVTNAFGEMLMKRKYPFYVLYLTLPSDSVDVNVHPNKLDVRFENNNLIYSLFFEAVSRALINMDYVSSAEDKGLEKEYESRVNEKLKEQFTSLSSLSDSRNTTIIETPSPKKVDKAGVNLNPFSFNADHLTSEQRQETKEQVLDSVLRSNDGNVKDGFGLGSKLLERLSKTTNEEKFVSSGYSVGEQQSLGVQATIKKVGKIFNTYLIIEVDQDIFFIDQHAAHERVLYEKFKAQYDKKQIAIQPLLFPYVLSLNSLEAEILENNIPIMKSLGFDIDEFGDNTFKVSSVPAIVSEMNFDTFFSEFLAESRNISKKGSELIRDYLMQHSCKSAIKGGNDLTDDEINHLYAEMSQEKIKLFCPHGRPIAIRMSKHDIEKWFKRIV